MRKWILFILNIIFSLCILKFSSHPYIWIGLIWTLTFLWMCLKTPQQTYQAVLFNISLIVLFLTVAEIYFFKCSPEKCVQIGEYFSPATFIRNDLLGYAPPANANNILGKVLKNNRLVYKMEFSTDEYGQRIGYKVENAKESVVFFGCSFTFGVGLNDKETLPFLTGLQLNQQINTYNFSYGGYGAHQMLSALENGLVQKIVSEKPRYGIYVALPEHIERTAGKTPWSIYDPKYEMDKDGNIYFAGHFNDYSSKSFIWLNRLNNYLNKSYLIQKILPNIKKITEKAEQNIDFQRYVKVVIQSETLFKKYYPQASFHVILWPTHDKKRNEQIKILIEIFKRQHIQVHIVDEILPHFSLGNPDYFIKDDGHPTLLANKLIADYIVSHFPKI